MQTSQAPASDRFKVFVSYAREDGSPFAAQLVELLEDTGFDAFIDQEDIGAGDEWKRRLRQRIAASDTVIFVLTPAAALSRFCQWEADVAAGMGKRILVVAPGPTDHLSPPGRLANLQWISFHADPTRKGSGFYAGQKSLVASLRKDSDWHRQQTEIFLHAERWQQYGRSEDGLLRGIPLKQALAWRADVPTGKATPGIIDLFLEASAQATEAARAVVTRRADEDRAMQERLAQIEAERQEAELRARREERARQDDRSRQDDRTRQEEERRRQAEVWAAHQQREADRQRSSQFNQPAPQPVQARPAPVAPPRHDPAPSRAGNDIFGDPAFSRSHAAAKAGKPAKKPKPSSYDHDDHDDHEGHGGGSLAIIAAVLVLLVGGAGAVAMFLPTMPNPFSAIFAGGAPAEQAATDEAAEEGDAGAAATNDAPSADTPEVPVKPGGKKDPDTTAWLGAKDKGTLLAYRTYMTRDPKGGYYNNALQEARRRITALSVKPASNTIVLPGPVPFRDLPTREGAGRPQGAAGQKFTILDRISTPSEGEWFVLDRGGPWPFRFVSVADVNK